MQAKERPEARLVPADTNGIAIDPTLDPSALAPAFARFSRMHIPGFLTAPSAQRLHQALATDRTWICSTMGGGQTIDIPVEQLEALPPDQAARLIHLAHAEARDGFHYMFDNIRISDLVDGRRPVSAALAGAYGFLNSPAFLAFIRKATGDARANYVDAQATRYEPGHYLTQHDDLKPESGRLFAYVLNLTPHWRTDWGGLLTFIDEDGHVAEAYRPSWNALNIFRVPAAHAVSSVAPFAGAPRLSITGWIRHVDLNSPTRRAPGRS